MKETDYAGWFRRSTPYISAHRGKTFVVFLGGDALAHPNLIHIVHDLALLHVLGVRLVLVHGARPQLDARLPAIEKKNGRRITQATEMSVIGGVLGELRMQLEALFSTGLPNTPLHNVDICVSSGNFVMARPLGIVDGIDHLCTGVFRSLKLQRVTRLLDTESIVLISPHGYSPSGQAFNLVAEDLAAEVSVALQADKLIILDDRACLENAEGERLSSVTPTYLEKELETFGEAGRTRLKALAFAVREGVTKGHLLSFEEDGALLKELFKADGVGTQVVKEKTNSIREANLADVSGIVEIIRPLEESGVLVRRSRDRLEREISNFLVAEIDGVVVGCCAVYAGEDMAELACVVVHQHFRNGGSGIGSGLLLAAERSAKTMGATALFALTTGAQDWFLDQGFLEADVDSLPKSKQSLYNWQRGSKVMTKALH